MSYITKSLTIVITLITAITSTPYEYSYNPYPKQYTRNIYIKQGILRGVIQETRINKGIKLVEVYKGIPYAAPPVGRLRFMPSSGAPSWFGVKTADSFGPVCPQKFPNVRNASYLRRAYFLRLKEHLQNQSEDCLYLNIYAPHSEPEESNPEKYPVMLFIHGESYEWNSGNPYDGSVLAAYSRVIVVTLNFRLGILGFLKTGTEATSSVNSNFGLVDQTAALIWIRDNIAPFGGDVTAVTVIGHGTGAACANLLMISPMMINGDKRLFHRAILLSGTSLSDWAMATNTAKVTSQVAKAVDCEIDDNFSECLRRKRLEDADVYDDFSNPYQTNLGPIIDSLVVPNDPSKSMTEFNDLFKKYELLYGVTEMESVDFLGPVALFQGMLEKERDEELRKYMQTRCDKNVEMCMRRTLDAYRQTIHSDEFPGSGTDRPALARNVLLDILSDARTVAPVIRTGRYHSTPNMQSYFYVFTHKTHSREYIRNKTYHGEELPYIFGVPLGGPTTLYNDTYIEEEKLLSEVVMTYFRNFAYTGNPNVPRKEKYETMNPMYWKMFAEEWPEFDPNLEQYIELDIPTKIGEHYKAKEMKYWNEDFPEISQGRVYSNPQLPKSYPSSSPPIIILPSRSNYSKSPPPWIVFPPPPEDSDERTRRPLETVYGKEIQFGPSRPSNIVNKDVYGTVLEAPAKEVKQDLNMNVFTVVGGVFLMANLILFLIIYLKCYRNRKHNTVKSERVVVSGEKIQPDEEAFLMNGCNIVNMMSRSSRSEDTYEATKSETQGYKLRREISGSTIDAHTKVRDWIAQEIIYKYSPRFFRRPERPNRPQQPLPAETDLSKEPDGTSTIGRTPTRPVTPVESKEVPKHLPKTSTVTRPKLKPAKVSVAVDATPSGRGPSVLMQQPIELTKSLDYPTIKPHVEVPLRRSLTLEDFSPRTVDKEDDGDLRKSITNINLESSLIKIDHKHSRSDPVQDVDYAAMKRLKTFQPDVNVTSKDERDVPHRPLSPEESLQIIKRRNCPKVLPDHPGREALISKRRSMPAQGLFLPIPESCCFSQPNSPMGNSCNKLPPAPPPRTSTLTRQNSGSKPVFISEPTLSEEPTEQDQETVCNTLFVGPIVPGNKPETKVNGINPQNLYEALKKPREETDGTKSIRTISPNPNVRRADPKVVVRPSLTKKPSDDKLHRHIPRVVVPDNQPHLQRPPSVDDLKEKSEKPSEVKDRKFEAHNEGLLGQPPKIIRPVKKSQIPTLIKSSNTSLNKESSSESPSDNSDTGTVVKLNGAEKK